MTSLRRSLWPELYQPGHPEGNPEGYLRLDRVGVDRHDETTGLDRGALWAQHIAWSLRASGAGLARAKPGSANHGGATADVPEGFTTDVVAVASGCHWDFQIDSGVWGLPTWAKEPQFDEDGTDVWQPIAERFVPAFVPPMPSRTL